MTAYTQHKPPKIVVIGAGSAIFGLGTLATIMQSSLLRGSELALVDINAQGLELITALAHKMNQAWDSQITITSSTERRDVLSGADFVLVSIQVGPREEVWELDWRIPLNHGLRQPYAENGGPGAFAHTARNLPVILDIARDMEALCPNAWYLNLTNPLIRLTWAVSQHTKIKVLGLCHQLLWAYAMGAAVLADRWALSIPDGFHVHTDADNMAHFIPVAQAGLKHLDIKAAGINHFSWVYDIRDKETGEDLYPLLRERWFSEAYRDFEPLTREIFQIFGLMPTAGDSHMCEYLQQVHDPITKPWHKYDLKLQSWDGNRRRRVYRQQLAQAIVSEEKSVNELRHLERHDILDEGIPEIVAALHFGHNHYHQQLNVPNTGQIPNLPLGAIVETPGMLCGQGILPFSFPPLPKAIEELCRRELVRTEVVVEAAVSGSTQLALQALLLDPMISDIDRAKSILDDFLMTFKTYLPQFA